MFLFRFLVGAGIRSRGKRGVVGDGWEGVGQSGKVSWRFEPSQPQRITSGLKDSLVIDVVEINYQQFQ